MFFAHLPVLVVDLNQIELAGLPLLVVLDEPEAVFLPPLVEEVVELLEPVLAALELVLKFGEISLECGVQVLLHLVHSLLLGLFSLKLRADIQFSVDSSFGIHVYRRQLRLMLNSSL